MDELERWLAPLGLVQLAPALRANDVDLKILPELSEADLEKLGLSLGQRKKLLKAAACLPQPSSLAGQSAAPAPSLSAVSSAEQMSPGMSSTPDMERPSGVASRHFVHDAKASRIALNRR